MMIMENRKISRVTKLVFFTGMLIACAFSVNAGSVTIPYTFATDGILKAADLNGNNAAIKDEINDNDTKINNLQNLIADLQNRVTSIETMSFYKINIDFGSNIGTPATSFSGASSQLGVWNSITSTTTSLVSTAGTEHGVTLTLNANQLNVTGSYCMMYTNEEYLLCDGFLTNALSTWSITVSGLNDGNYNLYIYAITSDSTSSSETGLMDVNGTPVSSMPGEMYTALTEYISYVSVPVTVTNGSINISGTSPTENTGLSGLQIIPQ